MTVTYLKVEYREKDLARALGAKWDGVTKQWFIPSGFDTTEFARWLPSDSTMPIARSTPVDSTDQHTSLSQLLARVAQAVSYVTPSAEWVKAEISEFHMTKSGHGHLDLIELDSNKNLLGKASGKLFKTQADILLAKFFDATQSPLAAGMKVLLRVKAQFHSQYGFSLIIEDIDPTYTLGDISAKLSAIRDTLISEGIFAQNKQFSKPKEFCRVAVLSPQGAAGLGDFKQEADLLARFHLCQFHYYHAQFQGDVAASEICASLAKIQHDHAQHAFDALVIIRGGGATIDLGWLNDLNIARAVCLSALPVFSGIGHERDNTIIDEIAHSRFDTPSKVIGHILTTIVHHARQARSDIDSIQHAIGNSLKHSQQTLDHTYQKVCLDMQQHITLTSVNVNNHYQRMLAMAQHQQTQIAQATDHLHSQIITRAAHGIQQVQQVLDSAMQTIQTIPQAHVIWLNQQCQAYHQQITESIANNCYYFEVELKKLFLHIVSLGPDATLKRGFNLATDLQGQPITSMAAARQHTHFQLTFHDGFLAVKPDPQGPL